LLDIPSRGRAQQRLSRRAVDDRGVRLQAGQQPCCPPGGSGQAPAGILALGLGHEFL